MTSPFRQPSAWWQAIVLGFAMTLNVASVNGDVQRGSAPRQSAPRPGALSGIAIDASSSVPVAGAVVTLRVIEPYLPAGREVASTVTDSKGRFVFVELTPAPSFRLDVSRLGYLAFRSAATFPIQPGQWIENLTVALVPAAQVEARLMLANGDPAIQAQVRLWRELWVAGQSRLVPIETATTNDVGAVLFANLQPGRYAVCLEAVRTTLPEDIAVDVSQQPTLAALVQAPAITIGRSRLVLDESLLAPRTSGRRLTYRPECEPAIANTGSDGLLQLEPGQTKQVSLRLTAVPGFTVSGQVIGPARTYKALPLRLFAEDVAASAFGGRRDIATTFVDQGGRFTFADIPAGTYSVEPGDSISSYVLGNVGSTPPVSPAGWVSGTIVQAIVTTSTTSVKLDSRFDRHASEHWGRARIGVSADVDDVILRLDPGGHLSARLTWPERPGSSISVVVEPADGNPSLGLPSGYVPQRKFESDGAAVDIDRIRPGSYFIRLQGIGARGWTIRSIRYGGEELVERPVEWRAGQDRSGVVIEIARDVASMAGRVRNADETGSGSTVIVFPVDRSAWRPLGLTPPRFRAVPVTVAAQYQVANLPAGRYYVAAIRGAPPPDWASAAALERLATIAIERELKSGANLAVELQAREMPR